MNDVRIQKIAEIPAYEGEYAIPGIQFRYAAKALGVTAWGMNVLEIGPHNEGCPEHDHIGDGQEEVYVILRGGGVILIDGKDRMPIEEGMLVRVGPSTKRKLLPDARGMHVLAIGGTPGQAFKSMLG